MENTRIQKLLQSEYKDLTKEPILLESPFAETTREGKGIREVALGLTRSRLIIAMDILRDNKIFHCHPDVDPSIESLELVSIYPLELIKLSVFQKRRRRALKARLVDGRAKYYELGGLCRRTNYWNLWCEQVRSLVKRGRLDSSLSETSVVQSSSSVGTSCYFLSSGYEYDGTKGRCYRRDVSCAKWNRKDLYLGPLHEELYNGHYVPNPVAVSGGNIKKIKDELKDLSPRRNEDKTSKKLSDYSSKLVRKLYRFGCGVDEKCNYNLCLDDRKNKYPPHINIHKLIEDSVLLWEKNKKKTRIQHRLNISPATYYLNGLGPWTIQPGERRLSVQSRRSRSCVIIRRQPMDDELRLPISRCQIFANASFTDFPRTIWCSKVVLFWTPDYWYRPRATVDTYHETRDHLARIQKFHERKCTRYRQLHRRSVEYRKALHCELKTNYQLTLWDLDCATLARQLTLIDRKLFLQITVQELDLTIQQRTSRNSPNLRAWIAFAHRVSCLTASQVLAVKTVRKRARLISRLLNASNRCIEAGNFQSARSIVAGLQSPAVYR